MSGLTGAAASQAASAATQYYLVSNGVDPTDPKFNALMEAASAVISAAAGGGVGGSVAVDGDRYNRQPHVPIIKAISDDLAQKCATEQGVTVYEAKGTLLRAAMSEYDSEGGYR